MAISSEEADQYRAELLEAHDKAEALENKLETTQVEGLKRLELARAQLAIQEKDLSKLLEESVALKK